MFGRICNIQRLDWKRCTPALVSSQRRSLIVLWIMCFASLVIIWQRNLLIDGLWGSKVDAKPMPMLRPFAFNLTEFGGKGDGVTENTKAFEKAIMEISKLWKKGGGQLNVPPGDWLTAPFNLTSHMTLFLAEGATILILGIQNEELWPLMPPLPSYGGGREHAGPRYGSLIHGQHLKDVVITGHNGTINGQGLSWWKKYKQKLLNYTRGPLLQILWSNDIHISNITLRDSPFWTIHPYDCKNVFITNVTILAPVFGAPNTDGIDPGDDGIAIKSGWNQYGISYGRPSTNILIRNLVVRSTVSAGVSTGSEMSAGVSNVTVENVVVWSSRRAMRIKTAAGRGGYIQNITYQNITLDDVRAGFVVKINYNQHPDAGYDPKAYPILG
ncbi:hypothetical protein C5167_023465, partial [Papaver somniferum]